MNFMINPLYAVMVRQAKVRHCGGLRESSTGLSGQWCLKLDLSPTTKELILPITLTPWKRILGLGRQHSPAGT